jgi:hypothetical protein
VAIAATPKAKRVKADDLMIAMSVKPASKSIADARGLEAA